MIVDLHQLTEWLRGKEDEHFELKEAKAYDFEKLRIHIDAPELSSLEDLVPMALDQFKRLFEEAGPAFSAGIRVAGTHADPAPEAVDVFWRRWHPAPKPNPTQFKPKTEVQAMNQQWVGIFLKNRIAGVLKR